MDKTESELNRHDRVLPYPPGPARMQHKTISELKAEFAPFNILNDRQSYCLVELQELTRNKGIETRVVKNKRKERLGGSAKRSFTRSLGKGLD